MKNIDSQRTAQIGDWEVTVDRSGERSVELLVHERWSDATFAVTASRPEELLALAEALLSAATRLTFDEPRVLSMQDMPAPAPSAGRAVAAGERQSQLV